MLTEQEDKERIFKVYYPKLVKFFENKNFKMDAEDLSSVVIEKILLNYHKLSSVERECSWVFTVATNTLRDAARKVRIKKRKEKDTNTPDWSITGKEKGIEDIKDEFSDGYFREMETEQLQYQVRKAIKNLSYRHREVLIPYFWHEKQLKQVADELGIPEGTAKSRISRAYDSLESSLSDYIYSRI